MLVTLIYGAIMVSIGIAIGRTRLGRLGVREWNWSRTVYGDGRGKKIKTVVIFDLALFSILNPKKAYKLFKKRNEPVLAPEVKLNPNFAKNAEVAQ